MHRILLILSFALATTDPAIAQEFLFDPPQPDSSMAVRVVLRGWGLSGPCGVATGAFVERSGPDIRIELRLPFSGACGSGDIAWTQVADLGILPAGRYRVRVYPTDPYRSPNQVLHDRELIVTDAAAPFRIEPNAAPTTGGEVILIASAREICVRTCSGVEVFFGGVPAGAPYGDNAWGRVVVAAPPHAAGAVDVEVRGPDWTLTAPVAFRYFDPSDDPDPTLFEPILVPLLFRGAGASGSEWDTHLRIANHWLSSSDVRLRQGRAIRFYESSIGTLQPDASLIIRPGEGRDANGTIIRPLRQAADGVVFAARIVELTSGNFTQLPIVRERDFRRGTLVLPEVPLPPGARVTLRIYALDQARLGVLMKPARSDRDTVLGYESIWLQKTEDHGLWYAEIRDLHAFAAESTLPDFVQISIGTPLGSTAGNDTSIRFWAFVSITDNETQHVSLFTPQ